MYQSWDAQSYTVVILRISGKYCKHVESVTEMVSDYPKTGVAKQMVVIALQIATHIRLPRYLSR